ncbi:MAG: hypothetical protein PHZ26_04625 [Candidatus Gracilibacteria bacterium]|nr:hypothetical protein [Candidatus Gracilibacteria bacterium]
MKIQKIIALALLSCYPFSITLAETAVPVTQETIINLQNIIKGFSDTIKKLQDENTKLQNQIAELNSKLGIPTVIIPKTTVVTGIISNSGNIINSGALTVSGVTNITKASNVEKYNIIVDKINSTSAKIFEGNSLPAYSSIGLFEFIEPSNFFISIDDEANPTGITAFKKKILYSYDKDFNLTVVGIFDLDYKSQYYITKFGKNPFARTVRIRVKNPIYKGKLLEIDNSTPKTTSTSTATTSNTVNQTPVATPTSSVNLSSVTLESVKTAYSKNKILDALKLSTEYIKTDPNNIDVAKIRYRSFYILGKYDDSLAEIQKIETNLGNNVEKTILCDAKIISKLAKKTDLQQKYTTLCANAK